MSQTLERQLLQRIGRKRGDVFVRADFRGTASYDHVGRALRQLVQREQPMKL